MNNNHIFSHSVSRGFISAQAAIVLAVIASGTGLLIHEWHGAHSKKGHHDSMPKHHHKKADADKTTAKR